MLTEDQIKTFKHELLESQERMINQTQDRFGMEVSYIDSVGELSSYDNHSGDMGTELFERGKDIALNEHVENELESVNKALHAIEEGTYGICRVCSQDIDFDRLKVLPTADTCVEHSEDKQTFSRHRPVEEEVYSPNINPDDETPETETGYDAEDAYQEVSRYGTSETPSDFYGDRDSYNEMYPNSDEDIGTVEDIEGFPAYE